MKLDYRDRKKPITAEDVIRGKGLNDLSEDRRGIERQRETLRLLEISFSQLKKNINWKKGNEVVGDASIELPETYSELSLSTKCNGKNFVIYLLKEEMDLLNSEFFFNSGCCWKSIIDENKKVSIKLESIENETDITLAKTILFYR